MSVSVTPLSASRSRKPLSIICKGGMEPEEGSKLERQKGPGTEDEPEEEKSVVAPQKLLC